MLKRLSEAISQSNIEGKSLTSEIYSPNHSFCNFSTEQNFKSKKSRIYAAGIPGGTSPAGSVVGCLVALARRY